MEFKTIKNTSKLGLLNYYFLQWFGIRLAKSIDIQTGKFLKYKILLGIVPMSGWDIQNPYRYFYFIKR